MIEPVINPPVILFPAHGCEGLGMISEKQAEKLLAENRDAIRSHWNHAGVKAIVSLIEQRGCRLQREAIGPGAGAHHQGQAFAMNELITVLHGILLSQESPGG